MSTSEIVSILAMVIAALGLAFNFLKDRRADVLAGQSTRDMLDSIATNVRDTRDDVREINRKLDDHTTRLVRCEARLEEHERRIANLEKE